MLNRLQPLFDYVPGDISPPQAPKHATNKPKLPRAAPPVKKQSMGIFTCRYKFERLINGRNKSKAKGESNE